MVSHGLTIALLLCATVWAQDPDPTVGVDVFSVATNGADPDPGTGVFIPPSGSGGQVPNIIFGRRTGKSNDPCQGHFVPVSQRQYFEMAAHPNQWLCADNGFSPGIHRVCADLQTLPRTCYDPNHQTPQMQGIVQNCLDRRTSCGRLLQQENCKDIFLLQSELRAGVTFPAPGAPEAAMTHWTPLYLARGLPDLVRQCQAQGFQPTSQVATTIRRGSGDYSSDDYNKGFTTGFTRCIGDLTGGIAPALSAPVQQGADRIAADIERQDYLTIFDDFRNIFGNEFLNLVNPDGVRTILSAPVALTNVSPEEQGDYQGYHFCQGALLVMSAMRRIPGVNPLAPIPKRRPTPLGNLPRRPPAVLTSRLLRTQDLDQIFGRKPAVDVLPNGAAPSRFKNTTWLETINLGCSKFNCTLNAISIVQALLGKAIIPTEALYVSKWAGPEFLSTVFGKDWIPMSSYDINEIVRSATEGGNGSIGLVGGSYVNASGKKLGGHVIVYGNDEGRIRFFQANFGSQPELTPAQAQAIPFGAGILHMRINY
jgi:hypothetical protein